MIVITPGHEETKNIFADCLGSRATAEQYRYFNRYGYYSTELYELSQASPLFEMGDAEKNEYFYLNLLMYSSNLRRYMNFVNFPSMMWYEKFNWDLYSCSSLNDPSMPVYSISYRYTLGHRSYFLPTHWFGYYYIWELSNVFLAIREQLNESFGGLYFYCMGIITIILFLAKPMVMCISATVYYVHTFLQPISKKIFCKSAIVKSLVSGVIGLVWLFSREVVPGTLLPRWGYFFFYIIDTLLLVIILVGFNKGTNAVMGMKYSSATSLRILLILHFTHGCK